MALSEQDHILLAGLDIVHHCKKHDQFNPECTKCQWWNKHHKCQHQAPFDGDKMYHDITKYYIEKQHYTVERANEIAQQKVLEEKQRRGIP